MSLAKPNPHAIVEIQRPGFAASDGQSQVIYDSWVHKRLFEKVEIDLVTNETSQATWGFFDPNYKLIDAFAGNSPVPMSTVRIYMGYGEELGEPLFKGLLASVEREQKTTTFTAFDMGFKMKLEKKAGYKAKADDIGIIKALAERNGLKFEGPEKPLQLEPHRSMMQDEQTDWDHVMERAHDAGLVIFVRQDTLFAKYPAKVTKPVMTLHGRPQTDTVLKSGWNFEFHTPESQEGKAKSVKHRGRGKGGKRIEGESDIASRGHQMVVLKKDAPGEHTKAKLSKRAQAQKDLEREHAFEGHAGILFPTDGERLDVRNTVMMTQIGKLFSGKYICDRVTYNFGPARLEVDLELYRDIDV
ncbi:MAG TPA: hypothetical protein VGO43_14140 [Pyrinomonadaceae bacterium]|jgi:phage protein D|nr:hypothetical protein [Pyrinomonadaceae bacterium]